VYEFSFASIASDPVRNRILAYAGMTTLWILISLLLPVHQAYSHRIGCVSYVISCQIE